VGTIGSIATGIAMVSGLPGVGFEELLEFSGGIFGIAFNVDVDAVGVVLLATTRACGPAMKSGGQDG